MRLRRFMAAALAAAGLGLGATAAQAGQTFDAVRARGTLNCGVNVGIAGFSLPDSQGVWRGMDADLCRGVAAAVFGDSSKVRFVPLTAVQRATALPVESPTARAQIGISNAGASEKCVPASCSSTVSCSQSGLRYSTVFSYLPPHNRLPLPNLTRGTKRVLTTSLHTYQLTRSTASRFSPERLDDG